MSHSYASCMGMKTLNAWHSNTVIVWEWQEIIKWLQMWQLEISDFQLSHLQSSMSYLHIPSDQAYPHISCIHAEYLVCFNKTMNLHLSAMMLHYDCKNIHLSLQFFHSIIWTTFCRQFSMHCLHNISGSSCSIILLQSFVLTVNLPSIRMVYCFSDTFVCIYLEKIYLKILDSF